MNNQNPPSDKKRIILLEDEDALAILYQKKLLNEGYDVRLYKTTDELLESFKDFNPDLALLDHALHGEKKSGLDIIPILKKQNPSIIIVMLSNYSKFQMEKDARKAGAHDYLLKINTSPAFLVGYVKNLFS